MIHSKGYQPKIFPYNGLGEPEEIARAQDIGGDLALNRDEINEIGRTGVVDYRKRAPTFRYTLRQLEYGAMNFFLALANKVGVNSINLDDFKTSKFDIASYLTDDNGSFKGTLWIPKMRVSALGFSIGDPESMIERSFEFVGEDYKILKDNYFIYKSATAGAGEVNKEVDCSSPAPVEYETGKYIFKVLRVRNNEATEIPRGIGNDTYSYVLATQRVIVTNCQVGDFIRVFYPSLTYVGDIWTPVGGVAGLSAEKVSIYLQASNYLYRIQSIGLDVGIDRRDLKEIGDVEIVQTGIRDKSVRITLGRLLEQFTIEELLAGGGSPIVIDPKNFLTNLSLIVKFYEDAEKTTFKMGLKVIKSTPTGISQGTPLEDYANLGTTLEADNLLITKVESDL